MAHERSAEDYITVTEASERYEFTTGYIRRLLRDGVIKGRKTSGGVWLVVASSVAEHKQRMEELGKRKHGLRT